MDPRRNSPQQLKQTLQARLQKAGNVALLAVGSELRGDDGVALRLAEMLEADTQKPSNLHVFVGATAPENCTGPIRRLTPTHLLVVDAADIGKEPGTVELLDTSHLAGVSFCTHALPLIVIVNYILGACPNCDVIVIGIQPAQLEFGRALSPPLEHAAQGLAHVIRDVLPADA